jgi:hypothetical protein
MNLTLVIEGVRLGKNLVLFVDLQTPQGAAKRKHWDSETIDDEC